MEIDVLGIDLATSKACVRPMSGLRDGRLTA